LGIEVEIVERPDDASFYDLMKRKEGDLWLEQGNQNDANPSFLPALLFYTGPGTSGSGSTQGIAAPGARFDELLAPVFSEVDLDRVRRSTAEALHVLIDVETTVIPLAGIYRIYGMSEGVEGFNPHPSFLNTRWDDVTLNGG
ncbi:MAG: ABC transporter substrate-binding protein, partial [Actinomycetota bacterium]|nr:ABC transporter substrate-binding protein [Actinomycetota bacterium]